MRSLNVTLVSGSSGAGKTTWIQQQVNAAPESALSLNTLSLNTLYLNIGAGMTAIDATYLATTVPQLTAYSDAELSQLLEQTESIATLYVEIGFQIEPASVKLPFTNANYRKVAVLSPDSLTPDWQDWADTIVPGVATPLNLQETQLRRSVLSGQVFDPASLETFWQELTQGAYGNVQRSKGIFEMADGRAFHFNFVAGLPETTYTELNLPRWVEGRPDRFSGIEIVGEAIDQAAIAHTIQDCCLDDSMIAYYQAQIKASLALAEETV